MSFNSQIGQKIQTAREEKGISQEQLAKFLGCSQAALSNYEKGKRRLYLSQLEKLSEILEKPLDFFVEYSSGSIASPPADSSSQLVTKLVNSINLLNEEQLCLVSEFIDFLQWKSKQGG